MSKEQLINFLKEMSEHNYNGLHIDPACRHNKNPDVIQYLIDELKYDVFKTTGYSLEETVYDCV